MNNLKGILQNVALFVIVLTICFGLGEISVRILFKDTTEMFPRYHTDARYGDFTLRRIRPNSRFTHTSIDGSWDFVTNAQGFRNYDDYHYIKPKGVIRIVVLGDSQTQGYESHQDYTYSSILEKLLKSNNIDAQVINTGVSGFSTAEELVLLEWEMVKYRPDYVVLGFFANDFQDNFKAGLYGLNENSELTLLGRTHIPGVKIQNFVYAIPGVHWLSENSYFYSILFNYTWAFFKQQLSHDAIVQSESAIATNGYASEKEMALTGAIIERMFNVTKKMNAKFIVLDIPRFGEGDTFETSVPEAFLSTVISNSDYFVSSDFLAEYNGAARIHVSHGQRHISEFTHTLFAGKVAKTIMDEQCGLCSLISQ